MKLGTIGRGLLPFLPLLVGVGLKFAPIAQPTGEQRVTLRLDHDVVEALRSSGKGWQTRVYGALRDWLDKSWPRGDA